jgi:hypothetical protein
MTHSIRFVLGALSFSSICFGGVGSIHGRITDCSSKKELHRVRYSAVDRAGQDFVMHHDRVAADSYVASRQPA